MKITAIKQQVRLKDRYSIYIDDKYSFSLSETGLLNSRLVVGQELDETELENIKADVQFDTAYYRSLDLIARRRRSEWELRDYLKRKGYDKTLAEPVIAKLKRAGHLDDLAFAKAWVENRRLLKLSSKRRLKQELQQKRLSDDVISQVLAEDETNEREVLREVVAKKRNLSRFKDDDLKLMQYLARQGYNYDDIKAVLKSEES